MTNKAVGIVNTSENHTGQMHLFTFIINSELVFIKIYWIIFPNNIYDHRVAANQCFILMHFF